MESQGGIKKRKAKIVSGYTMFHIKKCFPFRVFSIWTMVWTIVALGDEDDQHLPSS